MKGSNEGDHATGVGLDHWGVQFPETHWSILIKDREREAEQQFTYLCSRYWYPVYAYLRKRGYPSHDSQDLTQGFFTHLLSSSSSMEKLDPDRGRFRSYLLGAVNFYLNDQRKMENAQKRGGGQIPISIEEELAENRFQNEPSHDLTPEKLFDRGWAVTMLNDAKSRLEREFTDQGKPEIFAEVSDFLSSAPPPGAYTEIAERLKLKEDNVRAIVSRMRKRFKAILREQVHATVSSEEEVDGEIRHLLAAFSG